MKILLLHGFAGAPAMWDRVVEDLDPDIRVIRPYLPGHGSTPEPITGDFEEVADALYALGPDIVCGYSLGGRLAVSIAARHPEVSALLLSAHVGLPDERARVARRAWEDEKATDLERLGVDAFMEGWERMPIFATQRTLPKKVRAAQLRWRCDHTPAGLAGAMRKLGLGSMPDYRASLRGRFITGSLDDKFTTLTRDLGVSHRIVHGAGHNVVLEAPWVIVKELRALLR